MFVNKKYKKFVLKICLFRNRYLKIPIISQDIKKIIFKYRQKENRDN